MTNESTESTVKIIIKGIAICYRKESSPDEWRVLFPFDECHGINVSYVKSDGTPVDLGKLKKAKSPIVIEAPTATGTASATNAFKNNVLDMTSSNSNRPTHRAVKLKDKDNWDNNAVLLIIPKAELDVNMHLHDYPDAVKGIKIYLNDGRNEKEITGQPIAHSVKGRINLSGGQVRIKSGALPAPGHVDIEAGSTLTFDNDCRTNRGRNDMDMLYHVIVDADGSGAQFKITGRRADGGAKDFSNDVTEAQADQEQEVKRENKIDLLVEPPELTEGKPCLVVTVSDPKDLP